MRRLMPIGPLSLVTAMILVSCSGNDPGATPNSTNTSVPAANDRPSSLASVEASPGLSGVDVAVLHAVAPYDHDSNVDSLLVEMRVAGLADEALDACLRADGFTGAVPPRVLPDRDDPVLMASRSFPHIDRLDREGLPLSFDEADPGDDPSSSQQHQQSEVEQAMVACVEQSPDGHPAQERFSSVRSAWEDVLAAVETESEIRSLAQDFSTCLRNEGIPAASATDETRFLFHVDGLTFDAAGDREEQRAIGERYGQMYAECGRDLFEARERARGGRRAEFLDEHADTLRELSDLLDGAPGEDAS